VAQDIAEDATAGGHHDPTDFMAVRRRSMTRASPTRRPTSRLIPKSTVEPNEKEAPPGAAAGRPAEENDDVQDVYANFDISEEILEPSPVTAGSAGASAAGHTLRP